MLARHNVAMEDGTIVKPGEMTLAEWLSCWMKKYVYASGVCHVPYSIHGIATPFERR